ncbi:MAG TPA: hypothetical protein DEP84_30320 [Chloroflexi bacterium]|nr:hypothetical protein [Chloroflexota bacterium]
MSLVPSPPVPADWRPTVIACATVIEEMLPLLPDAVTTHTLALGLHTYPAKLRLALQEAIDASSDASVILLGYGLCSLAIVGLQARQCPLVVPKVDDCIAIFLGSRSAYLTESRGEPGTYYLTKGWIEGGDGSPFAEYDRMVRRFGPERAERMMHVLLKNYTRLALINTGQYEQERYRDYARRTAERFGLRYEEIDGSTALVEKMIFGPWDDDFLVVPPGQSITYEDFFPIKEPG